MSLRIMFNSYVHEQDLSKKPLNFKTLQLNEKLSSK